MPIIINILIYCNIFSIYFWKIYFFLALNVLNVAFQNIPPKSYCSKLLQSIKHTQVTYWIWDQNLMIRYCTSDIGIFPLRFLPRVRKKYIIAIYFYGSLPIIINTSIWIKVFTNNNKYINILQYYCNIFLKNIFFP